MHLAEPDVYGQGREFDRGVDGTLFVEDTFTQPVKAKAAALPANFLADAALLSGNYFLQARNAVRDGVFAHFDASIAPTHFVGHGGGGAGAMKGVDDEVAWVGGTKQNSLH